MSKESSKDKEKKSRSSKKDDKGKKKDSGAAEAAVEKDSSSSSLSTAASSAAAASMPASAASSSSLVAAASPSSSSSSSAAAAASSSVATQLDHMALLKKPVTLSDVTLQTTEKGRDLQAHWSVLAVRAPKILPAPSKGKQVKRKLFTNVVVEHTKNIAPQTLEVVLQFIYADNINFSALPPILVLHTLIASRQLELPRLGRLCEDHLHAIIDFENVYPLLKESEAAKETVVYEFCLDFACDNLRVFVSHKDRCSLLSQSLFQDVVYAALVDGRKPVARNPGPLPPSTIREDWNKIFDDSIHGGPAVADSYVTIAGTRINFHKQYLASLSPILSPLLQPKTVEEDLTEILAIKSCNLSAEAFTALLRHLYYGETSFSPNVACDLAPYAAKFQFATLQKLCEGNISSNIDDSNVLSILRVAYLAENSSRPDMKTLRENGVQHILKNIKSVQLEPLRSMDLQISVDILQAWKVAN